MSGNPTNAYELPDSDAVDFLSTVNDTQQPYDLDRCLHDLFARQAAATAEGVAVIFEADGEQLTYRELDERANRLANYLQRAGVGPETLVAVALERSLDLSVALLAVLMREGVDGDQRLVGFLIPEAGLKANPSDTAVRRHLAASLPAYMIPAMYRWINQFPTTPNGKLDRSALERIEKIPPLVAAADGGQRTAVRDQLERQLIGLWEQLLQVHPISVDDNFFELGGHSLLAARLFMQIEQTFGRKLPFATLFEARTVAALAELLRQEEWKPNWTSLVPIQPNGSRPPLYFVHAHGGNVLGYQDLAARLGPDQPIYGLQAQGLDGERPPFDTLEKMAAYYIGEVRSLQPRGPYYLGGWCMGGDIALEMARQIQAAGDEVGLLIFVQNTGPQYHSYSDDTLITRHKLNKLADHLRQESSNLRFVPNKWRFIAQRLRRGGELLKLAVEQGTEPLVTALGIDREWSDVYRHAALEAAHDAAHRAYRPRPYLGRVLLFRAAIQPLGVAHDEALGWRDLIEGELLIEEIPGHRVGMLNEPRVGQVAERMTHHLGTAQRRANS